MLYTLPKTYFYGEFGCLNYAILGHIEERQPAMVISTQPDYAKLMQMKCGRIRTDRNREIYRATCKGSGFGLSIQDPTIDELHDQGFISLHKLLGFTQERCIRYLKPIRSPLVCDTGLPPDQQYVSISFRNRGHEPERNLENNEWLNVLEVIRSHSDLPIIAHGMDIDTKGFQGVYRVNSIEESIAYLNKSRVFIASMSGIAQFASNCNCGIIQIGDPSRHIQYDPFGKGAVAVRANDFKSCLFDFLK